MAQDLALLGDLALVLVTAGAVALLCHKLRLPSVLGYLAAGVLVGPYLTPFHLVRDSADIQLLAQIGVVFLLFSLGLHFHLGKLRKVGGLALTAGVLEVSVMVAAGFGIARLFGWRAIDALFLGAILAISSTTIIVKVLSEQGLLRAATTEAIFGILLVEDVIAILLIALLSSIALTGSVSFIVVSGLVLRIAIFVVATLVIGLVVVPRVVDYIAKLRAEEVLVLFVVGIAFGTAMIAVALELSIALGAFIAGAIIAESRASETVERKVAPLRDVFAAVFFVSTGILINPADVLAYWPAILILAAVSIVGKIVAVSLATFVAGYPPQQAIKVGIGMAMIGEFSFVIATLGHDLGVTASFLFPIAVSISAITALVTPFLIRNSDAVVRGLGRLAPRALRNYAHTYSAWSGRIRHSGGEAYAGGYDAGALLRALSYGALLVALAFGASTYHEAITRPLGATTLVDAGYYTVFVLLCVPIIVGLSRNVRRLVDQLVRVVIPPSRADSKRGAAAASVLRNTLYAFLAVIIAVTAVAAGAAFLPPIPLFIGALLIVGVAAWFLRGSLLRFNRQLEEAVDTVFRVEGQRASSRDEVLDLIRERYPWDLHVMSIIVPVGSRAATRRIRDLQLPQKTGATIVTHDRDDVQTVNPPPDTMILAGDTIGVLGELEQVEAARAFLTAEAPPSQRPAAHAGDGIEVEEIQVTDGSPLKGVTLAGSRIRETTGASVVGVRRAGVPILNPAPVMRLHPGDSIVVLGSPAQVRAVRKLLSDK
ncbi:MAG: cation:proton antiporter [Candidatus Thermoplasmatota archaeon]